MRIIKDFLQKIPKTFKIIFVGTVLSTLTLFVLVLTTSTSEIINDGLSQRSKEFLQKSGQVDPNRYRYVFEDRDGVIQNLPDAGEVNVDCFDITIPFPIRETRSEGECHRLFLLANGQGQIVAYIKEINSDISEVPDISMRRVFKNKYLEDEFIAGDNKFLLFKNTESNYENVAFLPVSSTKLLVVSLVAPTNVDLDEKFKEILKTLQLR